MKNFIHLILLWGYTFCLYSHDIRESVPSVLECWTINNKEFEASFLFHRNEEIYLQHPSKELSKHHLLDFSTADQLKLNTYIQKIEAINSHHQHVINYSSIINISIALIFFIVIIVFSRLLLKNIFKAKFAVPIGFVFLFVIYGFTSKVLSPMMTDPLFIDAAFAPHQHIVNTRWDNTWFYVESLGIPDHQMMKGITAWQQQVPIPQCYTGSNSWQIPLNPEIATNPIPVNQMHFLRGAIALAVNGIAIFNPYTTTGIDALKDGQLDIYGGHSGRADDYHYHIAPFHLEDSLKNLPIAFALDGFPIYGTKEPDGSVMQVLDEFHGHFGKNGMYHYHGTKEFPYMIAKMKGNVTEDAMNQLIPQPRAKGVRPALTPLSGASITDFKDNPNGNGYILTYLRNGLQYKIDYSWTKAGKFTYHFISPTDTITEMYTGTEICELSTAVDNWIHSTENIQVYPNPSSKEINIDYNTPIIIRKLSVINSNGNRVWSSNEMKKTIDIQNFSKGIYFILIETPSSSITKIFIVQ